MEPLMEPYEEADLREDLLLDEEPEPPLEASLATVILLDEGGAQLLFDGEEEATSRRYRYLMSCANMQPNDRVMVQKVGGAYIAVGILAPPVHEETVQYAETAGHAEEADHAKTADTATNASYATRANQADYATRATNLDNNAGGTLQIAAFRSGSRNVVQVNSSATGIVTIYNA